MTHLRDAEYVDLLDGRLPADRLAHVTSCAACGAHVEAMRSTLASAQLDAGEEPSPLFWQHFASRVSARIDEAGTPARWWTRPRLTLAGFGALVVALLVFNVVMPLRTVDSRPAPRAVSADVAPPLLIPDDIDADEAWAVVRAAAEGLAAEDVEAAGLSAGPGAVERVAAELTEEERAELVRLVESELKRTGA